MSHAYKQVINVLTDPGLDYRRLVIDIAKHEPDILVLAHERVTLGSEWRKEVDSFLRNDQKVAAVKLWRSKKECTLKEAVVMVNLRKTELGLDE